MAEMFKLSALCLTISLLIIIVEQGSRVMGALVAVTGGVVFFGFILSRLQEVFLKISSLLSAADISLAFLTPVLKVLGITLCGRISGELCRDMGSRWAAGSIEIFSVLSALLCMIPLLENVLRLVDSL